MFRGSAVVRPPKQKKGYFFMKPQNRTYKSAIIACYIAYVVQALVNNTSPILFTLYESDLGVSLTMLANIILINFITQLVADLLSIKLIDIFGYRKLAYSAHILSAVGMVCLSILPRVLPSPYLGIVIATILCALGSGLIEVIISPIVDAIPNEEGSSSMSLLHSFYCWGSVFCVLFSTIAIKLLGDKWYLLTIILALIPAFNIITFTRARFSEFTEKNVRVPVKNLILSPLFILLVVIMICSGASELVISQWSSFFVEKALGVSKVVGDILGPCLFAIFMGTGRIVTGKLSSKISHEKMMLFCSICCFFCYLGTALLPGAFSLASCAFTGLMVSLMWPSTLSIASASFVGAGTTLFSILAFAGDIGCSIGPWLSGYISDAVESSSSLNSLAADLSLTSEQLGLRAGILLCSLFPLIMFFTLIAVIKIKKKKANSSKADA